MQIEQRQQTYKNEIFSISDTFHRILSIKLWSLSVCVRVTQHSLQFNRQIAKDSFRIMMQIFQTETTHISISTCTSFFTSPLSKLNIYSICIWKHFYLHETIASKKLRALTELLYFNFCRSGSLGLVFCFSFFFLFGFFQYFSFISFLSQFIQMKNFIQYVIDSIWKYGQKEYDEKYGNRKAYSYFRVKFEERVWKSQSLIFDMNWKEIEFISFLRDYSWRRIFGNSNSCAIVS